MKANLGRMFTIPYRFSQVSARVFFIKQIMELFEFKFYKSYIDIFDKLSDEDSWKLIKRMTSFYFRWEDIATDSVIVEVVFSQIKYTMEKSIQWKATGAIRTTVPDRVPSTVPDTTRTTKDKDKEQDKEQDKDKVKENEKVKIEINEQSISLNYLWDNDFRDSLLEHIRNKQTNQRTITEDVMLYFSDFNYQYNKSETYRSLREWIIELWRVHNKNAEELRHIFFNWHTYWTGQPKNKQPKDCKASVSKNPFLTQK